MFGNAYLTPEEFKELGSGVDLTGVTDDELGSMLMQSSRAVDNYCHTAFGINVVEMEQQPWNQSRRLYPHNRPIIAVRELRLLIGSRQHAEISLRDIFVNSTSGYAEVVSLATTISLSAELISLGLGQIIAQYSYIFGTGEFDDSTVNTAVALGTAPPSTGLESFAVTDGTRFQMDDIIRIDNEQMMVTTIVANTLTVLRGINNREDAHVNASDIYRMVSAAPDEVKIATGMVMGVHLAVNRQREEGLLGVKNFLIGSYSVSYSTSVDSIGGAGFYYIPAEAERLLQPYRVITVR